MNPVNWLNYVVPVIPAGDLTIDTDLTGWTIKNRPAQGHPTIRGRTRRDSSCAGVPVRPPSVWSQRRHSGDEPATAATRAVVLSALRSRQQAPNQRSKLHLRQSCNL